MLHNESVNVWSHLIGVALFIILLFWTIFALNPFASYLNFSAGFTTSFINNSPITNSTAMSTFQDFEAYCAKLFNVSLSAYAEDAIEITNEEAFQLWSKAW
jgi:predicted membrane channel-forming protein YqfA (hemolysin III family)